MVEPLLQKESIHSQIDDLNAITDVDSVGFPNAKGEINLFGDKGVERKKDTPEGKKVFDYTDNFRQKWEIVVGKNADNTYNIRIKKWKFIKKIGKEDWATEKYNESVKATNKKEFNEKLSAMLDETIGTVKDKKRVDLSKTGKKVYKDLNKNHSSTTETVEQSTTSQISGKPTNPQSNQMENVENNKEMPKGLRMENGVYVYRVQPNDTRIGIFNKLKAYEPLSYLNDGYSWSSQGANGFNLSEKYLPSSKFDKGVDLIVPNKEYTKNIYDFRKDQLTAIENMKTNSNYGDKIKKLFDSKKKGGYGYTEKQVANVMSAFARCESSNKAWNENIGECALFRYEPRSQVFSYGYHHIVLSLKNGVVKSNPPLAGDNALLGLGFNIGETCDPIKSGMLFLAFCIEKSPDCYYKFFDIDNNLNWCCDTYNGKGWESFNPNYDEKLKDNYNNIKALK